MSSPTALQRVLVIGSGTAGTHILNALGRRSSQFRTSLLVRPSILNNNNTKLADFTAAGVQLLPGDLSAPLDQLTTTLTGFDTVVSCLSYERYQLDQVKVVKAAKAAGVRRYFPTAWGVDEEAVGSPSAMSPIFEERIRNFAAIAEVGLPYTIVSNGLWSEWLLTRLLDIDYDKRVVTAINTFDSKVSTTTLKDMGELLCEVLLDPSTIHDKHIHLASDTVTLEDIALAVERATGSTFERKLTTMEVMEARRKATVFPQFDAGAIFHTLIANQRGVWWPKESTWNETHRVNYQVTKFNECADQVIKSGAHKTTTH